jgi:hypothetical protein
MDQTGERIARLEERSDSHDKTHEALNSGIKELTVSIQDLKLSLQKQRGFVGGVAFCVSSIWAVIGVTFSYLVKH